MTKAEPIVGRKVRVGVIGAGRWATIAHLPGWVRDPRCEVVAICDTDGALAETAKQTFGAEFVTTDYRELVERDDLDVVDVVTLEPRPLRAVDGRPRSPASTSSARSRSPTTSATPCGPPPWPTRRASKPSSASPSATPPVSSTPNRSSTKASSATPISSTATSRTRSGSIPRLPCARSIPRPTRAGSRSRPWRAMAPQSSISATGGSARTTPASSAR